MNNDKIILHLCADIGSDSYPFYRAGYDVRLIGKEIGVEGFVPPANVYGVFANPVCTEFSFAKWKHNEGKGNHEEGMFLVNHCLRIIEQCNPDFWVIENPANGRLKDFLGKPKMTYEPWHFGDPWTKRTALWGKFNIPVRIYNIYDDVPKNKKLYMRPGRSKPGFAFLHKSAIDNIDSLKQFKHKVNDDMSFRSLCPQGFANAFYQANKL